MTTEKNDWVAWREIEVDGFFVSDLPDPVPEPATFFLFGLGLLGLAGVSRKQK